MKEYQKHIQDNANDAKPKTSLCGESTYMEWAFLSVDHAINEVRRGGRLLPCPKCKKIVIKYLNGEVS